MHLPEVTKEDIPIALYVGHDDTMVTLVDSHWLVGQLNPAIVDYMEVPGGHLQFFVAKDFKYFTDRAMSVIKKYNPV